MTIKIKVILPVTTERFIEPSQREISKYISEETTVDVECLEHGTASIECAYDAALNAPSIIKVAQEAEEQGYDGIFIDCMDDPALEAVREVVDVPVVGPNRATSVFAADLSHRFSIITVMDNAITRFENHIKEIGLENKLASVRAIDVPVLELDDTELVEELVKEASDAVKEDGAHLIVLGCTGMMDVVDGVRKELDVPVLHPVAVAIKYLESLVSLGLSHSRLTYLEPPEKERNIWKVI